MRLPQPLRRDSVISSSPPSQNEPLGGAGGLGSNLPSALRAEDNLELALGLWLTEGRDMG